MRFVTGLVLRFGAAVLIAGLILYIFVFGPQRAIEGTINNHVKEAQNFDFSLQTARQRLKDLPNPETIIPGKKSARAYANKINEAKGAFSTAQLKISPLIDNQGRNDRIGNFNSVVSDPNYRQAITQGGAALSADHAFLVHHAAVMLALANLLEYDPVKDLSSDKTETLTQNLNAAKGGLQITIDRINSAPKYDNDKTLGKAAALIAEAQSARDKLTGTLNSDNFPKAKEVYINIVQRAQRDIIFNRNNFWAVESKRLLKMTDDAQKSFSVFLIRLQHV